MKSPGHVDFYLNFAAPTLRPDTGQEPKNARTDFWCETEPQRFFITGDGWRCDLILAKYSILMVVIFIYCCWIIIFIPIKWIFNMLIKKIRDYISYHI